MKSLIEANEAASKKCQAKMAEARKQMQAARQANAKARNAGKKEKPLPAMPSHAEMKQIWQAEFEKHA